MWLKLNAVDTHARPAAAAPVEMRYDEDLEREVPVSDNTPEPPAEVTFPILVNTDKVRSIYPRKPDRETGVAKPGTRITYDNSAADIVIEPFDTVWAWLHEVETVRSSPSADANQ